MKRPTRIIRLFTAAAVVFTLQAASADEPKKGVSTDGDKAAGAAKEESFDVEIKLTGNDTMQYDKKTFTVESGKKVKLTFTNIGKLPKAAMGHNVVILKKGSNKVGFATAAISAGPAADYMPAALKDQVLASTKLLGPGEEESIIFTAPEKGSYDYLCTFPGHFALMSGTMLVK